jgi:hypothetical protein
MPQFQLSTPPKHWFRGYNTDVASSQNTAIAVVADPKAVAGYEAVPCSDHNLAKLCFFEPSGTANRTARVHIYGYSPDGASSQFLPSFICALDVVIGARTGTGSAGPFLSTDLFADQITFVEGDDSIRIVSHNTSAASPNAADTIATVTIDLEGSTHLLVVFPALDGTGQAQNANFGYSLF